MQGPSGPSRDGSGVRLGSDAAQEARELSQDPAIVIGQVGIGHAIDDSASRGRDTVVVTLVRRAFGVDLAAHRMLRCVVWSAPTLALRRQRVMGLRLTLTLKPGAR